VYSQTIGVKTGLALASYTATSRSPDKIIVGTSAKPGFILGSHVDFGLTDHLFLRSGADIVVKGGIEEATYLYNGMSDTFKGSYNFAAVDFPLQLVYKMIAKARQGLLLGGGFVPGILIEGGLNKGDLGAGLLVGYQFSNGLNYNLSYTHGLVNVATHSFDYRKLKNRYLGVTVGYQFRNSAPSNSLTNISQQELVAVPEAPAKALFAEIGGSGGFLSLNYDTRLTKSYKGWGLRIGLGTITDLNSVALTVPFGLNYLSGEKTHFFEMAVGATFFGFSEQNQDSWFSFRNLKFLAPNAWIGYRYQPMDKRFFFRGGFNQYFASGISGFLAYPFPGFSFGYSIH
jgi:hypothetical protein